MLLKQGTLGKNSTRYEEDAFQLITDVDPVDHAQLINVLKSSIHLEVLHWAMVDLHRKGYALLGSRGYAYSFEELAKLLQLHIEGANINLNCFPRTAGLRAFITNKKSLNNKG